MRYVTIPGTDITASVICMGGGPLCLEDNDKDVFALLDEFYELGGNFIDSANIYGKWLPSGRNVCDINIGGWLRARGLRNRIIVTSKGAHPPLSDMEKPRLRKEEVAADLEESLIALGSGCIDLYYLHRDDPSIPVEYIVDYLCDFVREGKIRYFGVSNWTAPRIRAAQDYAVSHGKQRISANQIMWSFAGPDMSKAELPMLVSMDAESAAYHAESGLTAIAYESQAHGFFQKYAAGGMALMSTSMKDLYGSAENIRRYERAAALSAELGVSLTAVVLGYILNQPFSSIGIIGGHTREQIADSMAAADIKLTPGQIHYLETGV